MPELSIFLAFAVGLLGGVHRVGMCGGIVTALSFATPYAKPGMGMLLGYNVGRVSSYVLVGASALLLNHFLPGLSDK